MPIKDIITIDKNGDGGVVKTTTGYIRRYLAIYDNDNKYYYLGGNLHRDDGPAVELSNGKNEWWLFGQKISCSSNEEFNIYLKNKAFW